MSFYDPTSAYTASGEALDEHLDSCPTCSVGVACPDGDDKAWREYLDFRDLRQTDPEAAKSAQQRAYGRS